MYTHIHSHPHGSQTLGGLTWTQRATTASSCSSLWPSKMGVNEWQYTCTYAHVRAGSLQQPGSHPQIAQQLHLDPGLPSCWHWHIKIPKSTALLQLLVQTIAHARTYTELTRSPLSSTPGHWGWGSPGTAVGRARKMHPFPLQLFCSTHLGLHQWVFDGLMAPVMSLGVAGPGLFFGLPLLPLPLCSLVDV